MVIKYFFLIILIIIFSCHSNQPENQTQSPQSSPNVLPELRTGTKSEFKKIEKLPEGIENIFGKMPSKENGFYKFSFPR